jgi:hypothetical protein
MNNGNANESQYYVIRTVPVYNYSTEVNIAIDVLCHLAI